MIIESGIDIEVLGGTDIGIEIAKSISGILILVIDISNKILKYHAILTNHICHEYFLNFCLGLGILENFVLFTFQTTFFAF